MAVDNPYTKSLLHFWGANLSTTFTDESGKTWTAHGDAKISTAQYKFPPSSGLFDGTGDYVDTPDHADFAFGAGEMTLECWIRIAGGAGAFRWIFGQCDASQTNSTRSASIFLGSNNKLNGEIHSGSTGYTISSDAAYTDTNWHHVAFVRAVNTLMLFVDGAKQSATADVTGVTQNDSSNLPTLGREGENAANYWNGNIAEFRVSKIARWSANFTPQTTPYAPMGGFWPLVA